MNVLTEDEDLEPDTPFMEAGVKRTDANNWPCSARDVPKVQGTGKSNLYEKVVYIGGLGSNLECLGAAGGALLTMPRSTNAFVTRFWRYSRCRGVS